MPFYIGDSLSPEETDEMESHLEHCPECNQDLVFFTLLFAKEMERRSGK